MPDFENKKRITIKPAGLRGSVAVPGSKSELIRAVFCAALCDGQSRIGGVCLSEDVCAALRCAEALGAVWHREGDTVWIAGGMKKPEPTFDCGESAAVLRFAIPAAMALCGGGSFAGRGRLMSRPLEPYLALFRQWGTEYELEDGRLKLRGKLPCGEHHVSGTVSSQFVSGLLLALPLVGGGSVYAEGTLQSSGYADMTCDAMRRAGIRVRRDGDWFRVDGSYAPFEMSASGDWSQAAFWLAANHLGADISMKNLKTDSGQPDEIIELFARQMQTAGELRFSLESNPDLLPPLALMAAVRDGNCVFTGCERLRYKESDRLKSVASTLDRLGASVSIDGDELCVCGRSRLRGGCVDSFGDHRIAMMAAVASLACESPVEISGADAVNKSYPDFFRDFDRLGGFGCVTVSG